MFPGITTSPPYFLTPSLLPALSRPFLDDPPAFFVAIIYLIYLLATSASTFSTFLVGFIIFPASDKTLPSFEKILLILINENCCLCPFFLLEFCLLLFLKIKTVLFLPFSTRSASTFAPSTTGEPTSIVLSSP